MTRNDFRYFDRLRVRWVEVDMQKIVFNGHYLMYVDTAIAGYWRALALPYHNTMMALQGDLYVRKATLEYFASARYEDQLDVGIRCARIGNSSMGFEAGIFRGESLLVSSELVYVFANPDTQTSLPVPQPLRDVLLGFEAGEPMLDVRLGDWATLGTQAQAIRTEVFVDEQSVPLDVERDVADAGALHALAINRFGVPLGTGRLLPSSAGIARIGRMAVLAPMRGAHIGRALLDALVGAARQRGDREVRLHAQAGAVPFYARAGFVAQGEPFTEAGIVHQEMSRRL
jgi:YbgC/YbaW family acyl-CoA thioester hydrolase